MLSPEGRMRKLISDDEAFESADDKSRHEARMRRGDYFIRSFKLAAIDDPTIEIVASERRPNNFDDGRVIAGCTVLLNGLPGRPTLVTVDDISHLSKDDFSLDERIWLLMDEESNAYIPDDKVLLASNSNMEICAMDIVGRDESGSKAYEVPKEAFLRACFGGLAAPLDAELVKSRDKSVPLKELAERDNHE